MRSKLSYNTSELSYHCTVMVKHLNEILGNIDLYLLDQILKGNIPHDARILDAGCGEGRNLTYFLNNRFDAYGIDSNEEAIQMLHFILGSKYDHYAKSRFEIGNIDDLPYNDVYFDYLICNAVLHFSSDIDQFWASISELHRVTKAGGTLFIRMTSDIGLGTIHETNTKHVYELPDGSTRFLINRQLIHELKDRFGFEDTEPLKTVLVDDKRAMTTLILRKRS